MLLTLIALFSVGDGGSVQPFVRPLLADVGLLVEVVEEVVEEDGVGEDDDDRPFGVVAVAPEQLEEVVESQAELDQLKRREVLLPPEVLLQARPHGGEHIIRVHDDVNEAVYEANKGSVATRVVFDRAPRYHRHSRVMVEVEKGYLLLLFPQDEENRVEKLRYLGEEVDVEAAGNPHRLGRH